MIENLVFTGSIYERLYLSHDAVVDEEAKKKIQNALGSLYSTVLSSMVLCIRLSRMGSLNRAFQTAANPRTVSNLVNELEKAGKATKEAADNCEKWQMGSLVQNLPDDFRLLRDILDRQFLRIDSQLSDLWVNDIGRDRRRMLRWISAIPYESDHDFARRNRLEGTGVWLLDHREYQEWRDVSSPAVFWLHGIRKWPCDSPPTSPKRWGQLLTTQIISGGWKNKAILSCCRCASRISQKARKRRGTCIFLLRSEPRGSLQPR
jgi:hypothetical protein